MSIFQDFGVLEKRPILDYKEKALAMGYFEKRSHLFTPEVRLL